MTSNELEIFKQSILDDVRVMMQTTGQVTQYIGARYVPLFSDPLEWDAQREYEPLTIVLHNGNSYTSRQFTPKGVDISDTNFWANTGNYNAQIEQYRREVAAFDSRITANADSITALETQVNNINVPFEDPILVAIGDSWVNPTTKWYKEAQWPKIAAEMLGCSGFENLSVEGAGGGFTNLSVNEADRYVSFNAQVAYAENHFTEAQKINTKYVVIIGGTNDFGYGDIALSKWVENVGIVLKHASKVFPNAKILHLIDNSLCKDNPSESESSNNEQRWNKLTSFIPSIYNYNLPYSRLDLIPSMVTNNYYNTDWLHPNKAGCTMIGYLVATLLNGNLYSFNRAPSYIDSFEGVAETNQKATVCANHDGTVSITFNSLTIKSDGNTNITPNVKLKTILGYVNPLNPVTCTAYKNDMTLAIDYKINSSIIAVRNIDSVNSGEQTVKLVVNFRLG